MAKISQLDMLKKHFGVRKTISNIEAQNLYKIRALPRRICDLEVKGMKFNRIMKTDPTGQRYVRYALVD
jgi:hypothetical protein|tara:strand:- start:995 stop:1201 length:207 start_codon:yes stop_codon:yes gene_type:complete